MLTIVRYDGFRIVLQTALVCASLYVLFAPQTKPFRLLGIYHHELSHAGVSLLTGGGVLAVNVALQEEGGSFQSAADSGLIVGLAGYLGSMVVGCLWLVGSTRRATGAVAALLTLFASGGSFFLPVDHGAAACAALMVALSVAVLLAGWLWSALGALLLRTVGTFLCLHVAFDFLADAQTRGSDIDQFAVALGVPSMACAILYFGALLALAAAATVRSVRGDLRPGPFLFPSLSSWFDNCRTKKDYGYGNNPAPMAPRWWSYLLSDGYRFPSLRCAWANSPPRCGRSAPPFAVLRHWCWGLSFRTSPVSVLTYRSAAARLGTPYAALRLF
ncbi:MAG: hypothetical protein G01um101431_508 [Parcubacteria group bacterium Gr01-1014_31]|nr:MAG: hypothetical protein G01um101431_508 [Parcubacteria group bacterium Gr01-1014_31]